MIIVYTIVYTCNRYRYVGWYTMVLSDKVCSICGSTFKCKTEKECPRNCLCPECSPESRLVDETNVKEIIAIMLECFRKEDIESALLAKLI